jgi:C4-dicarboxylate-binding protein DctP
MLLVLAFIAPAQAQNEPIKLRLSMQFAANEPFIGMSALQYKMDAEKAAANSLTLEIFDKGRLYIDDQVLDAVKSGAIEMGIVGINQIAKVVPAASILEQPFVFNFDALVRAATSSDSEMRQLIDDAVLKSAGLRVLWWATIGRQVLFSKNGDLQMPSRLQGLKVRAFSETMARFVKQCEGVPIDVSISKIHQALEDGTLDMGMASASAVQSRDLWQVTKAITRTDHASIEFLVVVNEKTWQSLSDTHKRLLMETAAKVEREARERAYQLETAAYEFARSKGMTVYDLAPSEVVEWRACSSDVTSDYLDQGGELAQRLMKAYAKLRMQPCCSKGPSPHANLSGQ